MPARDLYHDVVVRALIKAGWRVSDEQVAIILGDRHLWIDIEATNDADHRVILVELKSFENVASPVEYWAAAVGKYVIYRAALDYAEIATPLFMAIPVAAYAGVVGEDIGQLTIAREGISLMLFDPAREEVIRWIP